MRQLEYTSYGEPTTASYDIVRLGRSGWETVSYKFCHMHHCSVVPTQEGLLPVVWLMDQLGWFGP